MSDRPVQVVLDVSTILAFCAGSVAVGELLAEVDDEEGVMGLPVLCVAEASRSTPARDHLELLVNHHATRLLALDADYWQSLAIMTHEIVGRADAASAALAALLHDCHVLTAWPALYAGLDNGGPVLLLEEPADE
ncbi:hypothetical protein [Polymorphospora sp. NPDC050346]|uniref:hypothetical protein n=1 Tax=Polymorphospora sp. NPDC050346 TaxID=3155780 RepID=UPI0033C1D501